MSYDHKFITILGPTASGKTGLALRLAQKYNGEIVCADSRTIYNGMDIGTAKPTKEEQGLIPHHLLDICTPDRPFSAAEFKDTANKVIKEIQQRGKLPFLVGGSGMYIDAVLYDYTFRNEESKTTIAELNTKTLSELQSIAKKKYPKEFGDIDAQNRRRVEQLITKGPSKDDDRMYNETSSLVLGLDIKEPMLKQNIAIRTKYILSNDFMQEVIGLRTQYGDTDILLHTTGYAQVIDFLNGSIEKDELEVAIVNATWQLSRKQMTWFRRNKDIIWFATQEEAEQQINSYLHK